MTLATSAAPYLNGYALQDDNLSSLLVGGLVNVQEPAQVVPGTDLELFSGLGTVRAQPTHYPARTFSLLGAIPKGSNQADVQGRMATLWSAFSGRPNRLQIGSLYLDVDLDQVSFLGDRKDLPGYLGWSCSGVAIPALWRGLYDTGVGQVQGIPVRDDRPTNTATLTTGALITLINPGDAPCYAILNCSNSTAGYASKSYYVHNLHADAPARIAFRTNASGYARVEEADGLLLLPGINWLQLEDATGVALSTGTWNWSWWETHWRYLGNSGDRMAETPPVNLGRPGTADYLNVAGTCSVALADQPRIGLPYVVIRNLVWDSGFIYTALSTYWSALFGSTPTLYRDATRGYLRITRSGSNAGARYTRTGATNAGIPCLPSTSYRLTFSYRHLSGSGVLYHAFTGRTSGDVMDGGAVDVSHAAASTWTPYTVAITTGASAVKIWLDFYAYADADILVSEIMVEQTSSSTSVYQPMHATGVDLTDARNGAGLVLEQAATNVLTSNDLSAWGAVGGVGVAASGTGPWGNTQYAVTDSSAVAYQYLDRTFAGVITNSQWYSFGLHLKKEAVGTAYPGFDVILSGGTSIDTHVRLDTLTGVCAVTSFSAGGMAVPIVQVQDAGTHWRVMVTGQNNASGNTNLRVQIFPAPGTTLAGGFEIAAVATHYFSEPSFVVGLPFPRSYVPVALQVPADTCALAEPHNLLLQSNALTLTPWTTDAARGTYTASYGLGPDNATPGTRFVMAGAAAYGGKIQNFVGLVPAAAYTFSVWMKGEAGGESVMIQCGNPSAPTTKTYTLTTAWMRYPVTSTATAAGTLLVEVGSYPGAAGAMAYQVWGACLSAGSYAAPYVLTSTAIVPSPWACVWPASITQNGYIQFSVITPSVGAGTGYFAVWGALESGVSIQKTLCLFHSNSDPRVYFDRAFTGFTGTQGRLTHDYISRVCDGYLHTIKLTWGNYTTAGVRHMPQEIWIDGVLQATQDVAVLYAATAWTTPDRIWASDGNTNAVISALTFGPLAIPAGSTL